MRLLRVNTARLSFDEATTAGYATRYPNDTADATTPATVVSGPTTNGALHGVTSSVAFGT